ncbi:MAG: anti-sigma factor family protein [Bryobacteraceae bacterium]
MNCMEIETLCPLYLSGELDTQHAAGFSEHLDSCHACADKVEQWIRLDSLLLRNASSEEFDCAALDRRIRQNIASRGPSFPTRWLAATAGIAVAFSIGLLIHRTVFSPPRLCVAAANDFRDEVILGEHRRWLSNPMAVANLAQRNGLSGSLITTLAPSGYHLEHGKLCHLNGRAFLHLVYAKGTSEVSIYLRPLDHQRLSGPVRGTANGRLLYEAEAGPEHIAYFQTGQLTAMFVTDQSSATALALARSAAFAL